MAQQTPDPYLNDSQPLPPPPPHVPEMTIMPVSDSVPPQPSGRSGCAWGIIGALGCLVVLLIPLVVVLLVSGVTINSFMGNVASIFQPRPAAASVISSQTILTGIQPMGELVSVSAQ